MRSQPGARLTVRATLLSNPPLWCWEIVDAISGKLVESSWQSRWEAYGSANEALRQAVPALQRLSRGPGLAGRPRVGVDAAAAGLPVGPPGRAADDDRPGPARGPVIGIPHTR